MSPYQRYPCLSSVKKQSLYPVFLYAPPAFTLLHSIYNLVYCTCLYLSSTSPHYSLCSTKTGTWGVLFSILPTITITEICKGSELFNTCWMNKQKYFRDLRMVFLSGRSQGGWRILHWNCPPAAKQLMILNLSIVMSIGNTSKNIFLPRDSILEGLHLKYYIQL